MKLRTQPNTITELRSLLGLVGYFRRATPTPCLGLRQYKTDITVLNSRF